jgi:diguanylate cyclase
MKRSWLIKMTRAPVGALSKGVMSLPMPDAVYCELVAALFHMRLPIAGMGILFGLAGMTIYMEHGGVVIGLVTAAAVIVTIARLILLTAYRREAHRTVLTVERVRQWERRYAMGSYAFATLLGALSATVLVMHSPLHHLVAVSLIFTFGAGIVSRIGGRPRICVISLLLATVPTIAALALHARNPDAGPMHAEYFVIEALLVAVVTLLSLESVRHLYRSDVERLIAKHDLADLVRQDALTGLPNRLLLRERFQNSLSVTASKDSQLAVHFLDLDGFKIINDRHGHPMGDAVLREVSVRLRSTVRSVDTVARIGGDEFIVVQEGVQHEGEAEMLARRIIKQLSAPYMLMDEPICISVSIGIAMAPRHGVDLEHLTACADAALYRSKRGGKAQLYFCTQEDVANAGRAVA